MRYLAASNPRHSKPITFVPMRGPHDCLTCVTAMLLGLDYEEVEKGFGGNFDPAKGEKEEGARISRAFFSFLHTHHFGLIEQSSWVAPVEGRRYWVGVKIAQSNENPYGLGHSIAVDELGRVFDPNAQYGEFPSLRKWHDAMTTPIEWDFASEVFEYTL